MKKSDWVALAIIGVIILAIIAVYFTFYYSYTCEDIGCFQAHQRKCSRTDYIKDSPDTVWRFFIQGKEDDKCEIDVEVVQIKSGTPTQQRLEGLSMTCLLPLDSIVSPESDIARCHGVLKEEMQNLIIQKLHTYVLDNLGDIGEELQNAI